MWLQGRTFDTTNLRLQHKPGRFMVGFNMGLNYYAKTKIGEVDLGNTVVGALQQMFGGRGGEMAQMGDGCVTSCL